MRLNLTHAVTVLACMLVCQLAMAQMALPGASADAYDRALHTNKLVRNKEVVLPVGRLDTLVVATLFDSQGHAGAMQGVADLYCAARHCDSAQDIPESCNFLILGVDSATRLTNDQVRTVVQGRTVVAILFDEDVYDIIPDIVRSDAIIHAFGAGVLGSEIAIQQIFGGTAFAEASAHVGDVRRLGYAPAATAGMDPVFLEEKVDSIAEHGVRAGAFPGAQVLVARHGKIVFHKAYGYHTYDSVRAVRLTDIYDLASITKIAATTAAIMRLHDAGRFDLDTTVGAYLPDFGRSDKAGLVWRDVLTHQARLQPWIPYWENTVKRNSKFKWGTFKTRQSRRFPVEIHDSLYLHRNYRKKIFRAIRKSALNPDTGYVYSGLAFYLLPDIIAGRSGMAFDDFLQQEVYGPLGAATMGFHPLWRLEADDIVPTERDTFFRMTQLHGRVHDEGAAMMGGLSGNAGLFSHAVDLAKLGQVLLNGGEYGGVRIFSGETVEEFTRCQFCDSGNHRGLGFDKPFIDPEKESVSICDSASPQSYGHSGYTGTLLWVDPAEELIYIFLSNRVYPTRLNRKLYTMDIRPAIHQVLYDAIVE